MAETADPAAWKRLGGDLERRRVEIDPRYASRTLFCEERGINYRLAYDIEEGRRANFRRTTLAGIASAYDVTLDWLLGILHGAAPEPPPRPWCLSAVPDESPAPDAGDALVAGLVNAWPGSELRRALQAIWSMDGASLEDRRQSLARALPPPAAEVPEGSDPLVAAIIAAWPDEGKRRTLAGYWGLYGVPPDVMGGHLLAALERGDPRAGERRERASGEGTGA